MIAAAHPLPPAGAIEPVTSGAAEIGRPPDSGRWTWVELAVLDALATLGPVATAVYVRLLRFADGRRVAYPSVSTLADSLGLSRRSVQRGLQALVKSGLVVAGRRENEAGGTTSNLYRLTRLPPAAPVSPQHYPLRHHSTTPCVTTALPPASNEPGALRHQSTTPCVTTALPPASPQHHEQDPREQEPSNKKRVRVASSVAIPAALDTVAFQAAWRGWLAYRRERRLTMTPRTLSAQLAKLAGVGEPAAMRAIRDSIESGWAGLFPKVNGNGRQIAGAAKRHTAPGDNYGDKGKV